MTRIVLARHGESVWHRADRYVGVSDIDLTDRGRAQARELGLWAAQQTTAGQGFAALWSSPLRRSHDTALAAGAATGLAVRTEPRLVELDFGIAEGAARRDLEREHTAQYAAFLADPVAHHWSGGEDPRVAADRVLAVWRDVAHAHPDQRVLVVAHATLFRLGLCALLGVDLNRYRTLFPRLTNGSISEIELEVDASGGPTRGGLLALNVPVGASGDAA